MTNPAVLIVDDEAAIRELLTITLTRMGLDCDAVADLSAARSALRLKPYQLCLTDMRLPDGDGLNLVSHIQSQYTQTPVAVITAHGNVEAAVQALKLGAFDFVNKPLDVTVLRKLVAHAIKLSLPGATSASGLVAEAGVARNDLIGACAPMQELKQKISKLARSQAPVHISGESGTGKERVARLIHALGARAAAPFVPVNCGAIPPELMESEFFGHKKGSFTGAHSDKPGLFQAAQGGTLFLDEIAELPLPMQVKLLRAIQEKSVRAVGAQAEEKTDVRILSATHKNLKSLLERGQFRQDLYYRIHVIEVQVPPLRERVGDIPLLVDFILGKITPASGSSATHLSEPAQAALARYAFPGNIRELENILERALTLSDGQTISVEDLHLPGAPAQEPPVLGAAARAETNLDAHLGEIEKRKILAALNETRWNRTAAAKKLGMTLRMLRYRLEKMGIGEDKN